MSTSQEYIHGVALSVGFGGQPTEKVSTPSAKQSEYKFDMDDEHEDEEEDIFDLLDQTEISNILSQCSPPRFTCCTKIVGPLQDCSA
jgi:hypothetical protein